MPPRAAPPPKLASLDLNLLVALDALVRELNVTAAGRLLGLSQPAMSQALSRLRDMLGDPILVREGRAMRATAQAVQLAPRVRRLIVEIEGTLLGHLTFDAATATRVFRLATNDYCGLVLLPQLLAQMRRTAPGVGLEIHAHHGDAPVNELARGELDLAVGVFLRTDAELAEEELFRDRFVCVVGEGHSGVADQLSLERYLALGHVLVSAPDYGPGVVDHALAGRGLTRRIVVRVPHFAVAPALVAGTDLVLTLPERAARIAERTYPVRIVAPPIELPDFAVRTVWHEPSSGGRACAWLRDAMREAARVVRTSHG